MSPQLRHTLLATLLAAVWIVTPLLSAVHIAVETHTYCAEHRTLEEGVTHHGAQNAPKESESGDTLRSGKSLPDDDSHTACAFGDPATRDIVPLALSIAVGEAPATGSCDAVLAEGITHCALGLLLVAPKTSPPHRA